MTYQNPALYEEPRNQPMKVIPSMLRESLLNWLESSGRFQSSEIDESQDDKIVEDLDIFLEAEVYTSENENEEELD